MMGEVVADKTRVRKKEDECKQERLRQRWTRNGCMRRMVIEKENEKGKGRKERMREGRGRDS